MPMYQNGSAEKTGLADRSVDAVVAAQSFHWFNTNQALTEFVRILKPKGSIILLINLRDESHSTTKIYSDLIRKYGDTETATYSIESSKTNTDNRLPESACLVNKQKFVFTNQQVLDQESLIARAFSVSYGPKDPQQKERLINDLSTLFDKDKYNDTVTLKYNLEVYVAFKSTS